MDAMKLFGSVVVAVLFFFAVIFALASAYAVTRLAVSAVLFLVGLGIAYYVFRRPAMPTVQRLEVSGEMKAVTIKCPNCGGSIDQSQIKILSGVPMATCPYCGQVFQVTEEPKW
jgi:predicted RNA-binding Zn-ribbon protein involved in translation (DUF1610 family)